MAASSSPKITLAALVVLYLSFLAWGRKPD